MTRPYKPRLGPPSYRLRAVKGYCEHCDRWTLTAANYRSPRNHLARCSNCRKKLPRVDLA